VTEIGSLNGNQIAAFTTTQLAAMLAGQIEALNAAAS